MEKYEIQKLRDLPIEGVAEQLGMVVKRHKALCPFHDDHHASLSFNTRRNSCRCYVCMGDSVGTIDLVMKYLGKDFLSACRWLAEVNGVYLEDSPSALSEMISGNRSHVLATQAGLYFPRLTPSGDWDLNLEVAGAGHSWYIHPLYPGGHSYGRLLIGDAMGGDANRYSLRLNHYLNAKTQLGLTLERLVQGASRPVSQRTSSVGLTLRHRLDEHLLLEATGGWASMDNADFIGGMNRKFKFANMQLTHRF